MGVEMISPGISFVQLSIRIMIYANFDLLRSLTKSRTQVKTNRKTKTQIVPTLRPLHLMLR